MESGKLEISVHVNENAATIYEKQFIEELLVSILKEYCQDFRLSMINKLIIVKKLDNNADGNFNIREKSLRLSRRLLDILHKNCRSYYAYRPINFKAVAADESIRNTLQTLTSTIFHELCHADNYHDMFNIYEVVLDNDSGDFIKMTALYWIEYVTHAQYRRIEDIQEIIMFCNQFYKNMPNLKCEVGYLRLLKNLSYFIYRWEAVAGNEFVEKLRPYHVVNVNELIVQTYEMTRELINGCSFNSYEPLIPLEKLFIDTYKNLQV